jgi:hypothetical protein
LAGSPELLEAERLAQEAEDASRKAHEAQEAVARLWEEYNSLPAKAEAIKARLAAIGNELAELDPAKIRAEVLDLIKAGANGAIVNTEYYQNLTAKLVTCDIRREAFTELQTELEAELSNLHKLNKTLGKRLGRTQSL